MVRRQADRIFEDLGGDDGLDRDFQTGDIVKEGCSLRRR